jgi:hypothetical protein
MRLVYHPLVQKDVNGIIKYYEGISPTLADEFWEELRRIINPDRAKCRPAASRGTRTSKGQSSAISLPHSVSATADDHSDHRRAA